MNEDELAQQLIDHRKKLAQPDRPITRTALWHWRVATDNGQHPPDQSDGGAIFLYSNPPIDVSDCVVDLNKVLICGTNVQNLTIDHPLLIPLTVKHDLGEPALVFCARPELFWPKFFRDLRAEDEEDEFLDEDNHSLPALIVSAGHMRDYNYPYGGCTIDVSRRIQDIADAWKVPIELVNIPHP
jgi:hypothetical protein